MPEVSIIIPNYNHSSFLKKRIECVLNQSFQDFEVIILDDCSTDNSCDIIKLYSVHPLVKHILYSEVNSGSTFKQWSKGIKVASGNYIWIAESDDMTDLFFLEKILMLFKSNESIGIAYSQSKKIDEAENEIGSMIEHTNSYNNSLWNTDFFMNGKEFVKKFMIKKNVIPNASAVVLKKNIVYLAGGVNTKYKINGDWDLYSRMLAQSNIGFLSQELNFFRQHSMKGSSYNIKNGNNIKEYYWLLKSWIDLLDFEKHEIIFLREHIFKNWLAQSEYSIKKMFTLNFWNIFPAAFKVDKMLLFRVIKKMVF